MLDRYYSKLVRAHIVDYGQLLLGLWLVNL